MRLPRLNQIQTHTNVYSSTINWARTSITVPERQSGWDHSATIKQEHAL